MDHLSAIKKKKEEQVQHATHHNRKEQKKALVRWVGVAGVAHEKRGCDCVVEVEPPFSSNKRFTFFHWKRFVVPLLGREHYAGTTVMHVVLTVSPVRHHGSPQTLHG